MVGGFESHSSCNRMATGGGWTLLGGSKASASVSCQTCHECLCQGTAREERGTALKGLPWGCSSACGHGVGLLHKSLVLFCTGPSISTVNVLTAPRLLGQSLPRSVRSKGLPTVRLVVHGNMLLVSPLLLSCPLHAGCLWKEMCSTEPFTASVPAKHWRLPSAVHGVEKG